MGASLPTPNAMEGDGVMTPAEIASRRLRIMNHALKELDKLGGVSQDERRSLVGSTGQQHSTPLATSITSEF